MSNHVQENPPSAERSGPGATGLGRRSPTAPALTLVEVDASLVVEGVMSPAGLVAQDVTAVGQMRETCPNCQGVPLQLVLRLNHVIYPHLFCRHCTRCFDAFFADGRPALKFAGMTLD